MLDQEGKKVKENRSKRGFMSKRGSEEKDGISCESIRFIWDTHAHKESSQRKEDTLNACQSILTFMFGNILFK